MDAILYSILYQYRYFIAFNFVAMGLQMKTSLFANSAFFACEIMCVMKLYCPFSNKQRQRLRISQLH